MSNAFSTRSATGKSRNLLSAVEIRSIDYVPLKERHGRLGDQATIWFAGGAQLLSLATGAIGISLGLNLIWTLIALVVGTILGTLPVAAHASQGPHLGLPQMVQSRPQFGRYGALFIWAMAILVYWGYVVLNTNLLGATAAELGMGSAPVWVLILGAVGVVIAIYGYDSLHIGQRLTTIALIVVLIIFAIGIALGGHIPADAMTLSGTFQFTPFLMVMSYALAYQLSWAFFVSDYSRYMPPTTSHRSIILYTAFGAGLGVVVMEALGAICAALFPKESLISGLAKSGNLVFSGLGTTLLILGGIALLVFNAMCVYGGSLTLITALDSIRPTRPSRSIRVKTIVLIAVTATIGGAVLPVDFLNTTFYTVLAVLAYLMAPWTAVNLVDYFIVRKGKYSIREIFNPTGMYGLWNWRGLTAYSLGFVVMIPFMYLTFFQGWVATALGGVDFAFFVGIPVAAISYWWLCRNLDVASELVRIGEVDHDLDAIAAPIA